MKNFASLLLMSLASTPAMAEVLTLPASPTAPAAALPERGTSMDAVLRDFGSPRTRHAARGGDSPKHPPITRWDYDGFSVFFENRHVISSVRPDAPAPVVAHREQLGH